MRLNKKIFLYDLSDIPLYLDRKKKKEKREENIIL